MSDLALCWIRRDLRLHDHRALYEACKQYKKVILVFIFDSLILTQLKDAFDKRLNFIYDSLAELDTNLKKKGSALVMRHGDPATEIPKFALEFKAAAVFTNEDYEPYAKNRDQTVAQILAKSSVKFLKFKDHVIFSGDELKKKDQTPYRVFTTYKNAWLLKLSKNDLKTFDPHLKHLLPIRHFLFTQYFAKNPRFLKLEQVGFKRTESIFTAGEGAGKKNLKLFSKKISNYDKARDFPSIEGTSRLSVHLRFGTISIRDCLRQCYQANSNGAKFWLSELIWRDFYQMILDQYPKVERQAFLEKYKAIKWPGLNKHFTAWCKGQTGYPIVDAAMRQLNQTGWMHNRLRMIVASFLVKDLLIDWRRGEKYFAEKLIDFDLAANNGGWQWCASTGCDAQPYFRIFNPIAQSLKFDANGDFIRTYVPELREFSNKDIHFPIATAKNKIPKSFKFGKNYPKPIITHSVQRLKAVKLYKT